MYKETLNQVLYYRLRLYKDKKSYVFFGTVLGQTFGDIYMGRNWTNMYFSHQLPSPQTYLVRGLKMDKYNKTLIDVQKLLGAHVKFTVGSKDYIILPFVKAWKGFFLDHLIYIPTTQYFALHLEFECPPPEVDVIAYLYGNLTIPFS